METNEKKEEDLPKSIVVVLVVLAVAISILGTFTVLQEMSKLNSAPVYRGEAIQSARVSLTVVDPNQGSPVATGKVVLRVVDREAE